MRGKIITCAIHKGGAGKTTGAVSLVNMAHEMGARVCLIDLDPQGNAGDNFVVEGACESFETASDLFKEQEAKPVFEVQPGLGLVFATDDLFSIERYPVEAASVFRLRLHELAAQFDLIVIDTPPTMGFAMLAPLIASDFAFSPIVPDAYSIKGVSSLFKRIQQVKKSHNPKLQFLGLLINQWNKRDSDQNKTVEQLKEKLAKYVIPHTIGFRSAIAKAARRKQPVWYKASTGSARTAAKEVKAAMQWIIENTKIEVKQ